ncbi:MAG TPA: YCF48-related protein [Thermoanaerobaculia bacterium]|nr:YCF48-related protein [Thermoanaerobaculia bacterium]
MHPRASSRIAVLALLAFVPSARSVLAQPAGEVWVREAPLGGVVTALVASPRNPNLLFAGTDGGGVFRGTVSSGGTVWSPLASGLGVGQIRALALAPSAPDVLYASVGEIPTAGGIWKSVDRGVTWTPVRRGLPPPPPFCGCGSLLPVKALAVHPRNPDVVYAGVEGGGVYKTVDGGGRWFPIGQGILGLTYVQSLVIDPVVPSTLYAGTRVGLYKSTSSGASWTYLGTALRRRTVSSLVLDPEDRNVIFAGTLAGVFRSRDAGLHWRIASAMPPVLSLAAVAGKGGAASTIWAGTRFGTWRSTDGGETWQPTGSGLRNLPVGALAVSPAQPRVVWAGTGNVDVYGQGIFRSVDAGVTWRVANRGLTAARITSLGVSPDPGAVLGTDGAGVFFEEASGWVAHNRGLGTMRVFSVARDPVDPEVVYAGTEHGLFKTVNGGQVWKPRNAGLPVAPLGVVPVRGLAVDPSAPDVVYAATTQGLFKSTDGAATWTQLPAGFIRADHIVLDPGDPRVIYATSRNILRSTDGGATWTELPVPAGESILTVAVDPADGDHLLAGSESGVLQSGDGGETWEKASQLPVLAVEALAVGPSPEEVWAGTPLGLYRSADGGVTWSLVPETRGAIVSALAVDVPGLGSVVAATLGAGLFERKLGE